MPLLENRTFGRRKRLTSSRATRTALSFGAAKCVPRPATSAIAAAITGWAWPITITPKPLW